MKATMQKTIAPTLAEKRSVDEWLHRNMEIETVLANKRPTPATQTLAADFRIGAWHTCPTLLSLGPSFWMLMTSLFACGTSTMTRTACQRAEASLSASLFHSSMRLSARVA